MDDPTRYKRLTTKAYDALVNELAEGFDHHFEIYARLEADYFLAQLNKGGRILDLGCGVGSASRYFVDQGYRPISADLSEEMVKECQRRGLGDLVRLDMEELPFPQATFAGIWAHTSLLHIPKHRLSLVIGRLGEILKTGGALFIALREGMKEGYEEEFGEQRWFAYYQATEFERHIPSVFRIERSNRIARQRVTFLNYQLVKVGK
jgi:cyclopropane fatty-acyl-phospholipid synthase-like methyltransferase